MIERILSYLFAAAGFLLVWSGRALSINLTEGQAFFQYWWIWLLACICFSAAGYAVSIGSKKE